MASFNKFQQFVENLGQKVMNLSTGGDTIKVMLTNSAPVATNSVKADLTEITAQNGYSAGGGTVGSTDWQQVSGTASFTGSDVTFTASGGSFGPFRYIVIYDDTPTSPADPLIGWWDYGSSISVNDTDTFTVDFGATICTLV